MLDENSRDYTIKLNSLELGVLTGVIMQLSERNKQPLKAVWEQLMALKKQIEEECGVRKEIVSGGMLRITDRDGNVIIRAPYPFEIGGN